MSKWEDFKNAVNMKIEKAARWCAEHPMLAMVVIPSVAGAAVEITKATTKVAKAKIEENHRMKTIYDPELGQYIDLKRPLKASEKVELAKRHTEGGENITCILDDMGRIK